MSNQTPFYFFHEDDSETGFCSQWYPSPFEHEGTTYHTAEHWMMACKARLFNDKATLKEIHLHTHPRDHKALGRNVKPWDQKVWDESNMYKFTRGPQSAHLRAQLLHTNDRELIEASPFDRIWGIGYRAKDAMKNRKTWGENRLGKVLMEVRRRLREEEEKREEEREKEEEEITSLKA